MLSFVQLPNILILISIVDRRRFMSRNGRTFGGPVDFPPASSWSIDRSLSYDTSNLDARLLLAPPLRAARAYMNEECTENHQEDRIGRFRDTSNWRVCFFFFPPLFRRPSLLIVFFGFEVSTSFSGLHFTVAVKDGHAKKCASRMRQICAVALMPRPLLLLLFIVCISEYWLQFAGIFIPHFFAVPSCIPPLVEKEFHVSNITV